MKEIKIQKECLLYQREWYEVYALIPPWISKDGFKIVSFSEEDIMNHRERLIGESMNKELLDKFEQQIIYAAIISLSMHR